MGFFYCSKQQTYYWPTFPAKLWAWIIIKVILKYKDQSVYSNYSVFQVKRVYIGSNHYLKQKTFLFTKINQSLLFGYVKNQQKKALFLSHWKLHQFVCVDTIIHILFVLFRFLISALIAVVKSFFEKLVQFWRSNNNFFFFSQLAVVW